MTVIEIDQPRNAKGPQLGWGPEVGEGGLEL